MKTTFTFKWQNASCRNFCISVIIVCLSLGNSFAQTFKNVLYGGGGFVSAIITSKSEQNLMYARTDVGGAYRWDAASSTWIPLLDWASSGETGYLGVESLAIDPVDPNIVYMSVGISYFNNGKSAILRSTDKGNTFTITDVTSQFKNHANGMGRNQGEKLAVDPNKNNIIYCGTRENGLFKSTNSGATWTRLTGLNVTTTSNSNGIGFVFIDPASGTSGSASQTIIVGVSRMNSTNIYKSTDGGTSFTAVTGAITTLIPQHCVLASDRNLIITYANGCGPYGTTAEPMNVGQIWKYNLTSGVWVNISPAGFTSALSGITVDPANPNRMVASSINTYMSQGGAWGDQIFLTTNGGTSWVNVIARGYALDNQGVTWMTSNQAIHWAGCIEFDPFNTQKVYVTSGNGIFMTDNIDATLCTWKFTVKGLEEIVPFDMVSIPNGPVISIVADYEGFRNTDVTQYGSQHIPTVGSTGLAVAALNPNVIVRAGTDMYYSTNMGVSWTKSTIKAAQGSVSLSADGTVLLHSPASSSSTYRSTNNGSTWSNVTGLNFSDARTVADAVNSSKFYAYNNQTGEFWASTNGGTSFAKTVTLASWGSKLVRTVPGYEGHIWIAMYNSGLMRSTNSGTSFTSFSNVSQCDAVGIGKAALGATYPTIYIWGTVGGVQGLYRSVDQGASWTRINDDNHEWGGPGNGQFVIGDMNVYGRVYMSTAGRGIVYVESGSTTVVPVSGVSVSPTTASVVAGSAVQLTASISPSNASNTSVSWSSANTSIATVNATGLVTGVATGTTTVTVTTLEGGYTATATVTVTAAPYDLALNHTAVASTVSSSSYAAAYAVDGLSTTQWRSNSETNPWIYVDLGATCSFSRVKLTWSTYYSKAYYIQTSADAVNWTTVSTLTGQNGATDDITGLNGQGRYVRIYITTRSNPAKGVYLISFEVYGNSLKKATLQLSEPLFDIAIYPNPAADYFAVTLNNSVKGEKISVNLYDLSGKLIYQNKFHEASSFEVSTDGFMEGIYILQVQKGIDRIVRKIIIGK